MNIEDWRSAGKIASDVREWSRDIVKKDAKVLDIATKIENKIKASGAELAFPVNLSFDNVAAHDTANFEDIRVLNQELVKVDVGVQVNGCIGDTALTIDLSGKYSRLIEAAEVALQSALEQVRKDPKLGLIGKQIEDSIVSHGFQPIRNLSGHGIAEYDVHDSPTIPNYDTKSSKELLRGKVYAIEPFATTGVGRIEEKGEGIIFSLANNSNVRDAITRKVLLHIQKKYKTLPFSKRELASSFKLGEVQYALKQLQMSNILHSYPPLIEVSCGMVAQVEHTFYIHDDGSVEILTK